MSTVTAFCITSTTWRAPTLALDTATRTVADVNTKCRLQAGSRPGRPPDRKRRTQTDTQTYLQISIHTVTYTHTHVLRHRHIHRRRL